MCILLSCRRARQKAKEEWISSPGGLHVTTAEYQPTSQEEFKINIKIISCVLSINVSCFSLAVICVLWWILIYSVGVHLFANNESSSSCKLLVCGAGFLS